MHYNQLPKEMQIQARQWAIDAVTELYENEGLLPPTESDEMVIQRYIECEYDIERVRVYGNIFEERLILDISHD